MRLVEYTEKARWNRVWNFKLRVCRESGEYLYPLTRVWKGSYMNHAGAMFGAPSAEIKCWLTREEFMMAVLRGDIK